MSKQKDQNFLFKQEPITRIQNKYFAPCFDKEFRILTIKLELRIKMNEN